MFVSVHVGIWKGHDGFDFGFVRTAQLSTFCPIVDSCGPTVQNDT
jgi:hypothetical protein